MSTFRRGCRLGLSSLIPAYGWDESALKYMADGVLINEVSLDDVVNGTVGNGTNPMRRLHISP